MSVDTALLGPFDASIGSLLQLIGQMDTSSDALHGVIHRARWRLQSHIYGWERAFVEGICNSSCEKGLGLEQPSQLTYS